MSSKLSMLFGTNFNELPPEQQKEIYLAYQSSLYAFVYYIVKEHQTVQDVLQDAFLKIIRRPPDMKDEKRAYAWLKVLTKNTALDYLRRMKRHQRAIHVDPEYGGGGPDETLGVAAWVEPERVDAKVEYYMLHDLIRYHLERIKPEYKAIIIMRWKLNLSYREIAARLNVTEDYVRQKLYRAREAMRKRVRRDWA